MKIDNDLSIARQALLKPIGDIAKEMGIPADLLELYGDKVAKVKLDAITALADRPRAKYVVVSAITPTPLGEGKTTTTVGLGQAMNISANVRLSLSGNLPWDPLLASKVAPPVEVTAK